MIHTGNPPQPLQPGYVMTDYLPYRKLLSDVGYVLLGAAGVPVYERQKH